MGKLAQEGTLNQMIWTVPEIISSISSQFQSNSRGSYIYWNSKWSRDDRKRRFA
jgi:hypothetical protein